MTTTAPGRSWRAPVLFLAPFAAIALILLPARPASAHPLDVTRQTSYITVTPTEVTVEVDIAAGVLVAPDFIDALDTDHDKTFSQAEATAYARRLLAGLTLRVDRHPIPLTLGSVDLPTYDQTRAGYGVLHVTTRATLSPADGDHDVFYRNDFTPPKPEYEATVLPAKNSPVTVGDQQRDTDRRQVETVFTIHAGPPATAPQTDASGWGIGRLLAMLQDPSRSSWLTVVAFGLAMLLGAFHALTPGHGKTMMAAYLVGSGGRVRDALALGASVTVTHTSSVLAIGAVALLASRYAVPDLLVPALELISGALVLGLGLRLLWQHRAALPWSKTVPGHHHSHDHGHDHTHDHQHRPGIGSVLALGVAGGLVPCPEALGVMILAVGLGHIVVGMLLIVSFSVGLAAVLIGIGVLLVRARTFAGLSGRLQSGAAARWARLLPVISAVVVVVLGAGLIVRTVAGSA